MKENLNIIAMQHRKIVMHLWSEEAVFEGKLPGDSAAFWAGIFKFENAIGEKPYKKLVPYAQACHSCPMSNAVVEHVFSQVTCMKAKYRNKMCPKILN